MAPNSDDMLRLHERMDGMVSIVGELRGDVRSIKEHCIPCQEQIRIHGEIIANLKNGYKPDTLTVRGTVKLMMALGALIGALGAAIGAVVAATIK